MKYIITLLSILYSINGFSQTPNPDLYQTWYLYDMFSSDDIIHHPIAAISPPVSPRMALTETLEYSGVAACNGFNGTYTCPADGFIQFTLLGATLNLCESIEQTNMEGSFFSLLQSGGQYYLGGSGDNMSLRIETPIFQNYVFGNRELGSRSFDISQTILYPNPVVSELNVNSQNNGIDKIEILTPIGQIIKTVTSGVTTIDLTDCAAGVYLIRLHAQGKTAIKKIVKK